VLVWGGHSCLPSADKSVRATRSYAFDAVSIGVVSSGIPGPIDELK